MYAGMFIIFIGVCSDCVCIPGFVSSPSMDSTDCIVLIVICCSFVVCLVIVWSL